MEVASTKPTTERDEMPILAQKKNNAKTTTS